ncbi:unnamed protein product [Choristocarpus tenellus]
MSPKEALGRSIIAKLPLPPPLVLESNFILSLTPLVKPPEEPSSGCPLRSVFWSPPSSLLLTTSTCPLSSSPPLVSLVPPLGFLASPI